MCDEEFIKNLRRVDDAFEETPPDSIADIYVLVCGWNEENGPGENLKFNCVNISTGYHISCRKKFPNGARAGQKTQSVLWSSKRLSPKHFNYLVQVLFDPNPFSSFPLYPNAPRIACIDRRPSTCHIASITWPLHFLVVL